MIKRYDPKENLFGEIDLSDAITKHSADEIVAYKMVDGEPIYMGYYFPHEYDRSKQYPVFLMVHGGAWSSHMIFEEQLHWQGDYLGYLARYYAERGFVSVSLDYRLARDCGETEYYGILECYEDCCDALNTVISNADMYGIDIERMYLLGESAGGHLAGALATFHYKKRYGFKNVILVNPITYLDDAKWERYVPVDTGKKCLEEFNFEQRAAFLSPLEQIDEETCDVTLIHGEEDGTVNPEHSRRFYERMKHFSRNCELHLIEKTKHAFLLAEYSKETDACKTGIGIINEILRKE